MEQQITVDLADMPNVKLAIVRAGIRCDGCPGGHNHYSAPGGQWGRPEPHSWCRKLQRAIPMVLGPHEKWLSSAIPADCPVYGAKPVAA